jgi:hypothetical protein
VAVHDPKDRSILYALLGVVALGLASFALLVIANGPPPPKTKPLSSLPSTTTAPPSTGPSAAALTERCRQIRAELAPLVQIVFTRVVGRPAGVPVGSGPEVASCAMAVGKVRRPAIATEYAHTTIDSYASSLVDYGWSKHDASGTGSLTEQLYTLLDGSHQIVLIGLPGGDLIALYDGT